MTNKITTTEDFHGVIVKRVGDWVLYLNGDIEYALEPYRRWVPYSDVKNSELANQYIKHMERKTWWTDQIGFNLTYIIASGWRLKKYLDERR